MAENHQETQVTTVVEGDDLVDTWRSPVHWIEIVLLFYIAGIFFPCLPECLFFIPSCSVNEYGATETDR